MQAQISLSLMKQLFSGAFVEMDIALVAGNQCSRVLWLVVVVHFRSFTAAASEVIHSHGDG